MPDRKSSAKAQRSTLVGGDDLTPDEVDEYFRGCETQEARERMLLAGAILRLRRKLLRETRKRESEEN